MSAFRALRSAMTGTAAAGCRRALQERSFNVAAKSSTTVAAKACSTGDQGRGAFIVLEGLDRSGKSTQCSRLVDYLASVGHAAEQMRFPDRDTATGKKIAAYLSNAVEIDDQVIHKLFVENRKEKRDEMLRKLQSGVTLIVDRYSFSGVAFSAAKGLSPEWCKAQEVDLPAPDLVLYLQITPQVAEQRGGFGNERYEKVEFQQKVAKQYMALKDDTWKLVDATRSVDELEAALRPLVLEQVEQCKSSNLDISTLWSAS